MLYVLDLIGTLAFAVTGAYKGKRRHLNIFGVCLMGLLTGVGGGTVRDVIIGRVPLFYLQDHNYLVVALLGSIATYLIPTFFKRAYSFFRLLDSIGLAAFVVIGTSISYAHLFIEQNGYPAYLPFVACVFMGITTGFGGGVIRDAVMGDTPFSLKKGSNYAVSAFLGSGTFFVLMPYDITLATFVSLGVTLIMREVVSPFGFYRKLHKAVRNRRALNNKS